VKALQFRRVTLDWTRAYIVGVVNVTPDSFSDGGRYEDAERAIAHGHALVAEGATVIDIGGESTRPVGARAVSADEEIARVVPVVRALAELPALVSIDTSKAVVAEAAVAAGAELVNDISGGLFDPAIVTVSADAGAGFVCGHVRGTDLASVHAQRGLGFEAVAADLEDRVAALPEVVRARTIVDPGLGFGKGTAANLALIRRSGELGARLDLPVMLGPSRKRFIGELTGEGIDDRDPATVGACLAGVAAGAQLLRVHHVKLLRSALTVYEAIRGDV
jgi:dihydropteroate synthase